MKTTPRLAFVTLVRKQHGLTLIEMMTALVIGSVLLAGLTQVFVASRQGYKLSESLGYVQEAGRLALYSISDDLRRAGYWGGNADISSFAGGSVATLAPTAANFNLCPSNTNWARMLQQRVFGLNDTSASYACLPASGAGSWVRGDVVVARFADSTQQQPADMNAATAANTLFIRTSLFEGRMFVGSANANPLNAISQSNGPVAAYALSGRGYYVGQSSVSCDGAAVPSLHRITLDNAGTPQVQDLVAGVEDLQIQWGFDSDGDGVPNQYLDANNVADPTFWNWPGFSANNTIVSARVWVLTRAECPDPTYSNEQTYEYGDKVGTLAYKPADRYRRQLYSATVALRN